MKRKMGISNIINCLDNHGIEWKMNKKTSEIMIIDSWVDTNGELNKMWVQSPNTVQEMIEYLQY